MILQIEITIAFEHPFVLTWGSNRILKIKKAKKALKDFLASAEKAHN